nr:acyltransferase [uncultured Lichenicoccus sp.]
MATAADCRPVANPDQQRSNRSNDRYGTLDALRGVAAVAVVLYHVSVYNLSPQFFPGGYLAVDFFFILSGFVIALAYEGPLQRQLSWTSFVVKRLIRLYPLALLGAMAGLAVLLMRWHIFPGKADPLWTILVSGLLNGLMLPTFFGEAASHLETFPGNGPLWTLFFEVAVNLAWAAIGFSMRTRHLFLVCVTSGMILIALALRFHTVDLGYMNATFVGGAARVCFGFPLGVVIYRISPHFPSHGILPKAPLLAASLLLVFALPTLRIGDVPLRDLAAILVVLPLIVLLGLASRSEGKVAAFLGRISYPIYVLHYPIVVVIAALHQTYLSRLNVHVLAGSAILLSLGMAVLASRFYDEPVRGYLSAVVARRSGKTVLSGRFGQETGSR